MLFAFRRAWFEEIFAEPSEKVGSRKILDAVVPGLLWAG